MALQIFSTPLVLENIESLFSECHNGRHSGDQETILSFCCRLALLPSARKRVAVRGSPHVCDIVGAAKDLALDTPAATRLLAVFAAHLQGQPELSAAAVNIWPSQRHANDCANFRDIAIVPAAAEVEEDAQTFLPLADGSDQWLQGQVRYFAGVPFALWSFQGAPEELCSCSCELVPAMNVCVPRCTSARGQTCMLAEHTAWRTVMVLAPAADGSRHGSSVPALSGGSGGQHSGRAARRLC